MADPRTFVLIGDFQDNITPALESINRSINQFKTNMATMTTKKGGGFNNVTQSVGKLVSAQRHLKEAIEGVGAAAKSATQDLKDYKSMLGKVSSAHYHIQKSGTAAGKAQSKFWDAAEKDLDDYKRKLEALQRQTQIKPYRSLPSPAGGRPPRNMDYSGQYNVPTRTKSRAPSREMPTRKQIEGDFADNFPMAKFTMTFGLAQAISQPIEQAIVSGFQIGVGLMMKPFEYFAGAFGERVQDQISDLKSAGALYSISKRSKNPFLKDIDEAIEFQQQTNAAFANLAKDLPGVTNDYVQVGKRLSDTAARIVTQDFAGALKFAQEIREKEGGKYYGSAEALTQVTGAEQQREVIETILGNLTKKATLGGMGNRSGAGGIAGAYGLPGIVERLVSEDEVSVAKFQRYASVFSDPAIADALARNVDKINATAKNSVERARMLDKVLDEIVTPEMIEKLRISVDGIYQGFRSMFMDPDTGLFGLGRQFVKIGKKLNSYGQYLDEFGNVVTDVNKAMSVDLSLFEILADIFAQFGQVLMPIVEILPLLFDPLKGIAKTLLDVRHYGAELNRTFNMYRNGLEQLAKEPGFAHVKDFKDVRASLLSIGNMLRAVGGISSSEFTEISKQITSKDFEQNMGAIVSDILDKVLNSDIAENIGKVVGSIVGTVIVEVAKVTGFISGRIESSNRLLDGLKKGFDDAGGGAALGNIFKDIFKSMFNALLYIAPKIPIEAYLVGAFMITLPVAIQTLGMAISHKFTEAVFGLADKVMGGKLFDLLEGGKVAAEVAESVEEATKVGKVVATNAREVAGMGAPLAQGKGNVRVTSSGIDKEDLKNIKKYNQEIRKGESFSVRSRRAADEIRNFGKYTAKGVGVTESFETSKAGLVPSGGAKVTQSLEALKADPKWKAFVKQMVGVGGEVESVFGRSFLNFLKKFQTFLSQVGPSLTNFIIDIDDYLFGGIDDIPSTGKIQDFATSFKNLFTKIDDFLIGIIDGSINIVDDIPGVNKIRNLGTTLKNLITKVDDVIIGMLDGNINILDDVVSGAKGLGAKGLGALKGAGGAIAGAGTGLASIARGGGITKGLPVFIKGFAQNAFKGKAAEGGRALIRQRTMAGSAARTAARAKQLGVGGMLAKGGKGFADFFGKGLKGLGKGGGILTAGVGIIEAISSLLSGDSLGTALGKGAGPVLGTIIGTALLGPLGGFIGGWIGGMKPVTDSLSEVFRTLVGALEGVGSAIISLGSLIGNVLSSIARVFGGGGDFDGLRAVLAPLTLAFQALEVGLKGLALLLEQIRVEYLKRFGTPEEYQGAIENRDILAEELEKAKARADVYNDSIRGTAALEKKLNDMRVEYISLVSSGDIKRAKSGYLRTYIESAEEQLVNELKKENQEKSEKLKTDRYLNAERKKQIEKDIEINKEKIKNLEANTQTPAGTRPEKPKDKPTDKPPAVGKVGYLTKNGVKGWQGTDGNWTPLVKPTQKGDAAKASLLGDLPKTSDATAKNTTNLNQKAVQQLNATNAAKTATDATKNAVVAQKASLNTIQSTISSIFALLASGGLRVQTQQQNPNIYINGQLQKNGGLGDLPFDTTQTDPNKPNSIFQWAKGGLGDAIASEMRMKPPGSDLVIANSSETVIPAAGGHGMMDFVEVLRAGFGAMVTTYKEAQQKQDNTLNAIKNTLISNQQQTNSRLAKLETKFSTPGMAGGLGGATAGGVDAFTGMAQRYGLQMTSAYRPGDPGWHGANRARDFSNGTGPTPQMLQFAQFLASNYGANLKELIYTPLGFSIRNGQKVAPYAQDSHNNHVHVAYAMGAGNPAFFSNKEDAVSWENKFLGKGVKSITTNTAELAQAGDGMMGPGWLPWNWGKLVDQERKTNKLNSTNRAIEEMVEKGYISPNSLYRQNSSGAGSGATVNVGGITVNADGIKDPQAVAMMVVDEIWGALDRSSSIFV
jgi:hypothetical protein